MAILLYLFSFIHDFLFILLEGTEVRLCQYKNLSFGLMVYSLQEVDKCF